ncbi:GNAT family N-acetyltransferase [Ruania suaedae]|nr:GNAT family N-acetyltransferase [Ruania suaedae]
MRARDRDVLVVEVAGAIVGYSMLVYGRPAAEDVLAAVSEQAGAELSKCYVLPEHHGTPAAVELMSATLQAAGRRGVGAVWLGVNQGNERAQRFYRKHGFARAGVRQFLVGASRESDYVMERTLTGAAG